MARDRLAYRQVAVVRAAPSDAHSPENACPRSYLRYGVFVGTPLAAVLMLIMRMRKRNENLASVTPSTKQGKYQQQKNERY